LRLVDTNIVSEAGRGSPEVAAWLMSIRPQSIEPSCPEILLGTLIFAAPPRQA
jgi:hypothetical protein